MPRVHRLFAHVTAMRRCHVTSIRHIISATSACRTLSHLPRQPAMSAADVTLPRVTLSVVTRVTLGLVQLRVENAKSA
jgi:hypothetical protein